MQGAKSRLMLSGTRSPLIVESAPASRDLSDLIGQERSQVETLLLEHGALLFRGFAVRALADFDHFVTAMTDRRLDYVYGSTPRTALGNGIYTATEYPPSHEIKLHNENAYQREWPLKLALCCLVPASSGGETPIADMRRVNAALGSAILEKFATRGVKYVRHYRPEVDVRWQDVFKTADREILAKICAERTISHEWLDDETLRTSQVCQGAASHPVTGERVFFNQAHLFHVSSLGDAMANSLLEVFGYDRLPRHTYHGDGGDIDPADLQVIHRAFIDSAITFPWQAGDVLLLDNMQFSHGRRPFQGTRNVLAALMDSYSPP